MMPFMVHRDRSVRVGIIGAGMSGMCLAAKLKDAGYHDFVVYEKAGEVGGTWRENTYPGLSCDVPCRFYSYSFLPNPSWTENFASGPEIQRYFVESSRTLGLRGHIRFNAEVVDARWHDGRWRVTTRDGTKDRVDVLVAATGVLHQPKLPDIPGLDTFAGAAFHSARWDHSVRLPDSRVAVVGTGSTGVQIVTALAGVAGRLELFQRTAQWVFPMPRLRYSGWSRRVMRRFPRLNRFSYRCYQKLLEHTFGTAVVRPGWQRTVMSAGARLHLRLVVRDRELRRKLTPPDPPMCKRLIISGGFYFAIQRDGVELVTDGIDHIEPRGIVTTDGALHEVDVIVLATGFHTHRFFRPMGLVGENGLTIEQAWQDGPNAYRTVALPGFPNFFVMLGPHSPIGNHSLVAIAETQADYILHWLERIQAGEVSAVAPKLDATAAYNAEIRAAMPDTIWTAGCQSWYLGKDGLPELWPWTPARHRDMLAHPRAEDFELT